MQRFVGCYLLNYFYYRSQNGQFEDDESPAVRMLFDSEIQKEKDQEKNNQRTR